MIVGGGCSIAVEPVAQASHLWNLIQVCTLKNINFVLVLFCFVLFCCCCCCCCCCFFFGGVGSLGGGGMVGEFPEYSSDSLSSTQVTFFTEWASAWNFVTAKRSVSRFENSNMSLNTSRALELYPLVACILLNFSCKCSLQNVISFFNGSIRQFPFS